MLYSTNATLYFLGLTPRHRIWKRQKCLLVLLEGQKVSIIQAIAKIPVIVFRYTLPPVSLCFGYSRCWHYC